MYYCFGCGAGGNVFTFIMEYENQTFPEAMKVLADRAGIALPEAEHDRRTEKGKKINGSCCWRSTKQQPTIFIIN